MTLDLSSTLDLSASGFPFLIQKFRFKNDGPHATVRAVIASSYLFMGISTALLHVSASNNDIFRCNTKREGKEDYEVYHGPIHKPQKYIQFMRPAATFT